MVDYLSEVVQAIPDEDRTVYAYFADGTVHHFDVKPLIAEGGVFKKLEDDAFFTDRLAVMNHAVAWDVSGDRDPYSCIDLGPGVMYDSAPIVEDPLRLSE